MYNDIVYEPLYNKILITQSTLYRNCPFHEMNVRFMKWMSIKCIFVKIHDLDEFHYLDIQFMK